MPSRSNSLPEQAREHDRAFHATFSAARQARDRRVKVRPHRAMTPLKVTPYLLAQAVTLPLLLCGLLFWGKPLLFDLWRNWILFWSRGLALPFTTEVNEVGQNILRLPAGFAGVPMPSDTTLVVTAALTLLGFVFSFRLNNAKFPLKYPLRIACVVQFVTVMYFWRMPLAFPYSIARHSEELLTIGFVVMLATPLMLAMGYYILNQSLWVKLFHSALILLFFTIMVPHQVLAQALIMQHLSVLFMPLLYIGFGAVFDALIFVALYSWAVSKAPPDATV